MPYPGTEAKLVGGPGPDEGELRAEEPRQHARLPQSSQGNRETATRWLVHTGDVCRRDAEGFYYFVGRTDDMFVSGGENIFPGEIEALLQRHPAVHQALVMPFDNELKGQVPYAFIVAKGGTVVSEEDLKQFALANGPAYQHPRRVFFLETVSTQRHQQGGSSERLAAGWSRCLEVRRALPLGE
jgi:acyl-CoA synthetase (AMP-forming)/AMP-acid ligase II